jgi:type III pantothenate kinase
VQLIAADIGNTRTHIGVFRLIGSGATLLRHKDVPHARAASPAAYVHADVVAYACVNPRVEGAFAAAVRRATGAKPHRLGRDFPPAIRNRYRPPGAAGPDRLANAAAAWARCRRACIVVDLGTAITFDVINARGEFVGGAIAPGLRLQSRALSEHTARLPRVAPAPVRRAIGTGTRDGIAAGLRLGVEGLLRTGIDRMSRELGTRARVFGTGGDAPSFEDFFDEICPALTLEGTALSYALSR